MRYHWEDISEEHTELLQKNDPKERGVTGKALTARREDGSMAGWASMVPGPFLTIASESPIVSIRLMERADNIARSFGLVAYGIVTRIEHLANCLRRLPGVSFSEHANGASWFIRTLR